MLEYDATQHQFIGGNFWDMRRRVTGLATRPPSKRRVRRPIRLRWDFPIAPAWCTEYRKASTGGSLSNWGTKSFAISWPPNVEAARRLRLAVLAARLSVPGPSSSVDRGTSNSTFERFCDVIVAAEASPDTSPFSSKFDYALSHPKQQVLSGEELAGWQLFRGKAQCNTCHLDGTENTERAATRVTPDFSQSLIASDQYPGPLFTDVQPHNLGVPANLRASLLLRDGRRRTRLCREPGGKRLSRWGAGAFLASSANPNREWAQYAPRFYWTIPNSNFAQCR